MHSVRYSQQSTRCLLSYIRYITINLSHETTWLFCWHGMPAASQIRLLRAQQLKIAEAAHVKADNSRDGYQQDGEGMDPHLMLRDGRPAWQQREHDQCCEF